jgi:hypothetical protein
MRGIAYEIPAIRGTDIVFDGSLIRSENQLMHEGSIIRSANKVGMFTAEDGICICQNGGKVENVSLRNISFVTIRNGAALIKQEAGIAGNINQYIAWV